MTIARLAPSKLCRAKGFVFFGSWAEIRHPNQSVHPSKNIPSEMWNSKWKQKVGRRIFSRFFRNYSTATVKPSLGSWSCRCQIVLQGRGQDMIARTTILLYCTWRDIVKVECMRVSIWSVWIRIRSSIIIRGISPAVSEEAPALAELVEFTSSIPWQDRAGESVGSFHPHCTQETQNRLDLLQKFLRKCFI